jgi:hypothetical protein
MSRQMADARRFLTRPMSLRASLEGTAEGGCPYILLSSYLLVPQR